MKKDEMLRLIEDPDFLEKIYQFAYHRCDTSFEAEDLCHDIILAVLSSIQKQTEIDHIYAYIWSIARRVYADFCKIRNKNKMAGMEDIKGSEMLLLSKNNEIDRFMEETIDAQDLNKIFHEISFLSKSYREVMVMYYIDEVKIKDIAGRLGIKQTTVKQRLFSARNIIRKEVENMNNRNLSLKPVHFEFLGTGDPVGNDPRVKAERTFSKNIIYLCKCEPKTAKELSEELCVPMPYIEEELEIQCRGENGSYGTLRKLGNGKYVANILVADAEEYRMANKIYEKYLPELCSILYDALEQNKELILEFPYLCPQDDIRFILWSLISRTIWNFTDKINEIISERFFSDVVPAERKFSCAAVAFHEGDKIDSDFYGCDGINAADIAGYKAVFVSNIYGRRIDAHFHCGHNISTDEKLLMTLRAVDGLQADCLTEEEKEIAAKAIECGYLFKKENRLLPKPIVVGQENEKKFYDLPSILTVNMQGIANAIAEELAVFMKQHIPGHLMGEYRLYQMLVDCSFLAKVIEECIKKGILSEPEKRCGAEGVVIMVKK